MITDTTEQDRSYAAGLKLAMRIVTASDRGDAEKAAISGLEAAGSDVREVATQALLALLSNAVGPLLRYADRTGSDVRAELMVSAREILNEIEAFNG
jgi:hypothetical protein